MTKKTEVATTAAPVPAFLNKTAIPRGAENVGSNDLVIPRLELVQSLSPCRKKSDPAYIDGAEEGMMFNSVTRELYGPEVTLIPVYYKKEFLLWKDRKKGGGFRGAFPTEAEAVNAQRTLEDGMDCEVTDTAQHFCLLVKPDGKLEEIVVSMSKSKLKTSRKWNSLIRISEVDSFAKTYVMSGVQQTNANGDDYYGFDVANGGWVEETAYRKAEHLYDMVREGSVKVSTDHEEGVVESEF